MLRIGQVEATATQDGKYTDGSVAGGIAATRLRAAAFNAMQEELAHIVESAGLALDINDMTQVLKAIQKLTLSRANPFADIKSDGAAAISTALTNLGLGASAFGLQNIVVFNTPGVYNWNVPEALQQGRKCQVTVIGGGASGGSTTDTTKRGGGGGGGGYSKLLLDLTDVSSVTVTVGFAGAGVTTGNGASGGSSSFGSYLSATGGQYGYGGTSTSGGSSGAGVGGDVNQGLGWGDDGSANSANCGGNGGGPGGRGSTGGGLDAPGYGGGGGGIAANSSNKSGSGKNGIVIIEW